MMNNSPAMKITLEINQETNLDELMAHLCLMQGAMPARKVPSEDLLPDFNIHEGELEPAEDGASGF